MGHSPQSPRQRYRRVGQLSQDCAARVVAFLVRLYPQKTAECVAADTGLSIAAVRKWLSRISAPSFAACMTLIAVYGPEFLSAVMNRPPAWIDTAARLARREALKAEIAALEGELAGEAFGEVNA